MTIRTQIPSALAIVADGRDHILTSEYAHAIGNEAQTVRKDYSQKGHCKGIRPIKVGNKLLWPVAAVAALLNGEKLVVRPERPQSHQRGRR